MDEHMYAIVRDSTFDPVKLAQGKEQLDEFQVLHASQPGYQGNILIDAGDGRMLILTLWDNQEAAMAGLWGGKTSVVLGGSFVDVV